jgi:PAS domain S-box-containing protein
MIVDDLHPAEPRPEAIRALFETMPIGVVYQDGDGRITAANPAAERILGLTLDQMQGRTSVDPRWRAIHEDGTPFPGEDHPAMVSLRTGAAVLGVTMGVHDAEGGLRWIRVDATPLPGRGRRAPREVYATFLDITGQLTAERALRESETRFRRLFGTMLEGFAYCRMLYDEQGAPDDFIYLSVNPAFERLTGVTGVDGRRATEVFPAIKTEAPELLATYGRVARTGVPAELDLDFTPLGLWLHIGVYQPEPDHFVAVFQDISEARRAEAALRRSQSDLSTLIDTIPEVAFAVDREYRLIAANAAFTSATSAAGGAPIERGESVMAPEYPDDFTRLWRGFYDRALAGEGFETDTSVPSADGVHFMENFLNPVRADDGEVTGVVVLSRDVTARRRAEAALRESEERLRLAHDAAKAGAWEWDLLTNKNVWSPEIWMLYDLEPDGREPSFELWLESVHADDRDTVKATVAAASAAGADLNAEWRVQTRDGSPRWLMSRGRPVRDADGCAVRYLGIVIDITERKTAEEEVLRLNAELEWRVQERTRALEAANTELQGFVYSVSHDLRTPLRTIGSYSQILLQDHGAELADDAADGLRRIARANERMVRLVDGILELSGLARSQMLVAPVDVSKLARDVAAEISAGEPERRVELVVQKGLSAAADEALLRLVFYNLLGNAWKFTAGRDVAHVAVGAVAQRGQTVFFVRDNGAGFDQQFADKLFTPFERLHHDAEFKGTGIGLATVKRIVERHGGRVWAEGEVDRGATVFFTLA